MIQNKVYRALKNITAPFEIIIKKDEELHVVSDVIYWNGYPLPFDMQEKIYSWLVNNEDFRDDTRQF
jgi:hypothetical protein